MADSIVPKPGDLLVSVCNVAAYPRHSCLLFVDLQDGRVNPVDVGAGSNWLVSGCGICADDTFIYHLTVAQHEFASWLTVMDRATLEFVYAQRLGEVIDGHSIVRYQDGLLVASSGTDEIISYRLDGHKAVEPSTFWSPTGAHKDTHHVNSVTVADGDVVCSAFGPKDDRGWATAKNGYLFNVTQDLQLTSGLQQPHSIAWHEGELFFCNSQCGSVNTLDRVVTTLDGYSRGLAFARDRRMYAATSVARHPVTSSNDGAVFGNPSDPGEFAGRSSIVAFLEGPEKCADLTMVDYAREIYDLWVFEPDGA